MNLYDVLVCDAISRRDVQRLVAQGAIRVNGETVRDASAEVSPGDNLMIGKTIFGAIVGPMRDLVAATPKP